jgi:lactoylglutathione lyase
MLAWLTSPPSRFKTARAVAAGAAPVVEPAEKPWGQVVSYVRGLNGLRVELCSEVTA